MDKERSFFVALLVAANSEALDIACEFDPDSTIGNRARIVIDFIEKAIDILATGGGFTGSGEVMWSD
jgi:hypothetical protein